MSLVIAFFDLGAICQFIAKFCKKRRLLILLKFCLFCLILVGHAYVQTPQGKSICAERKRIYSIKLGDADPRV